MIRVILLFALVVLSACQLTQSGICVLSSTSNYLPTGNVVGTVTFTNVSGLTNVLVNIASGLPANAQLGFHVHQYGFLGTSDGSGAGGHFNPYNQSHAYPSVTSRHVGDLGNLTTSGTGSAAANFTVDLIQFSGVASIIGRGLIIHAAADDGVSQPTGNSGARIAQCVIGLASSPTQSAIADQTGDLSATVELSPTTSTVQNTRQLSGRIIAKQVGSDIVMNGTICGFLPNTIHLVGITQFGDITGDLSNLGNLVLSTNVTSDVNGFVPVFFTFSNTLLSAVVGRGVAIFETSTSQSVINTNIALVGVFGVVNGAPAIPQCPIEIGACLLTPTATNNSTVAGTVIVKHVINDQNGVYLYVNIRNLPPNSVHAWHVHQYGNIGTSDGNGAGTHYNPYTYTHALPNNTIRHIGDMGNLQADSNGNSVFTTYMQSNLTSGFIGSASVIGRAFVIHSTFDDGTPPVGNAGSRLAQCVIGIANPSSALVNSPSANNTAISNAAGTSGTFNATCEVAGVNSNITGRVVLTEIQPNVLRVQATVCGLTPNYNHGFHVHQFGDLTGALINTNVASHYNPFGATHGYPESGVKHVGDLGNITTNADGVAYVDKTVQGVSLLGFYSVMGRSVVIH
ncbi:superoxide dismutase, partial [Acrasis kona]